MANTKISALTELTAPASGDYVPIVDASEATDDKTKKISVDNLFSYNDAIVFTPLTTALTSTAWDGDARSTTAKTLIDLSEVFSVPAGVKAILARIFLRDSGSAAGNSWFLLSPNDTKDVGALTLRATGIANDAFVDESGICPCDANGDVYYQCLATGSNTLDVWLQIWGYWL